MAETKECIRCGETKPLTEFHRQRGTFRAACKRCRKSVHYMNLYGITIEEYEAMFTEQRGRCALCGEPEKASLHGKVTRLTVDHDHDTGEVRGLLCRRCNWQLGLIEANFDLEALSMYLNGGENDR